MDDSTTEKQVIAPPPGKPAQPIREETPDLLRQIAAEVDFYAREQKPALTLADPEAFNKARASVLALSAEAEIAAGNADDKRSRSIRLALVHLQRNIAVRGT